MGRRSRALPGEICRPAPGEILGQGDLETGHLKFGRSQQKPYELGLTNQQRAEHDETDRSLKFR
jgi:hypothetical protein